MLLNFMKQKRHAAANLMAAISSGGLGGFLQDDGRRTRTPQESDELKESILAKSQAKREAYHKRVADRMWKGSVEHKYKQTQPIFTVRHVKRGVTFDYTGRTKSYNAYA